MKTFEKQLYFSDYPDTDGDNYWVSFENDPALTTTRGNIYGKCLPCIQNLYEQLQAKKTDITLESAFSCWKITAVLNTMDECMAVLQHYEKNFLHNHVYGKMGSGRPGSKTRAVIFHTDSETDRDQIFQHLQISAKQVDPEARVFISRACGILYDEILGDWREWKKTTPMKHPENAPQILDRVKRLLYQARL